MPHQELRDLGKAIDELGKVIYKQLEWLLVPILDFMASILGYFKKDT